MKNLQSSSNEANKIVKQTECHEKYHVLSTAVDNEPLCSLGSTRECQKSFLIWGTHGVSFCYKMKWQRWLHHFGQVYLQHGKSKRQFNKKTRNFDKGRHYQRQCWPILLYEKEHKGYIIFSIIHIWWFDHRNAKVIDVVVDQLKKNGLVLKVSKSLHDYLSCEIWSQLIKRKHGYNSPCWLRAWRKILANKY